MQKRDAASEDEHESEQGEEEGEFSDSGDDEVQPATEPAAAPEGDEPAAADDAAAEEEGDDGEQVRPPPPPPAHLPPCRSCPLCHVLRARRHSTPAHTMQGDDVEEGEEGEEAEEGEDEEEAQPPPSKAQRKPRLEPFEVPQAGDFWLHDNRFDPDANEGGEAAGGMRSDAAGQPHGARLEGGAASASAAAAAVRGARRRDLGDRNAHLRLQPVLKGVGRQDWARGRRIHLGRARCSAPSFRSSRLRREGACPPKSGRTCLPLASVRWVLERAVRARGEGAHRKACLCRCVFVLRYRESVCGRSAGALLAAGRVYYLGDSRHRC